MNVFGSAIYIVSNDMYTFFSMISKSLDGGMTWEYFEVDTVKGYTPSIAVRPENTDNIYIGGDYLSETGKVTGVVYKTVDDGYNWTKIYTAPEELEKSKQLVNKVILDPSAAKNIYIGSDHGILKSTDDGNSWLQIYPERCKSLYICKNGNVYASTDSGLIFSNNGGSSWQTLFIPNTEKKQKLYQVKVDEKNGIVYLGTNLGLLSFKM